MTASADWLLVSRKKSEQSFRLTIAPFRDMSHRIISSSACTSGQPGEQESEFVLKEISLSLIKLILYTEI